MLYLKLRVYCFEYFEKKKVKRIYQNHPLFKEIDGLRRSKLKGINPYRLCREYAQDSPYGETPISVLKHMVDMFKIEKGVSSIDLGSGLGRSVFFLNAYLKGMATGLERIFVFYKLCQEVVNEIPNTSIRFICGDLKSIDLSPYDLIYLYGTCLSDIDILQFIKNCKSTARKAKIITISYALTEYEPESFLTLDELNVSFPWGYTTAYLQIVK
ncbi:MAG: class I SAM-dependent methyltransferase [Rhabdochlamydiaceae bacterium]